MRQGKDLILSDSQTGSGHFACATSCTVSVKSDFIETAHPTAGGWKRYKPTILSWSASTGHLLASYDSYKFFLYKMRNHEAVTVRFYDVELQIFYKGQAYIETLELTGDVRGFAKMKVSLQPSGPLTAASEEDLEALDTSDLDRVYFVYSGGTWSIGQADTDQVNGMACQEVTLTAMKTRFFARKYRMIVNAEKSAVKAYMNLHTASEIKQWLLSKQVVSLDGDDRYALAGPGTYTLLVNYDDQDGQEDGTYMSSF
jgi:hypothetical protein